MDRAGSDDRFIAPPRDPHNPFDDRAVGLAILGTVVYCLITGLGIGVFFEQPYLGALGGAAIGVPLGVWLAPGLMRDWRD